ncbi:MBL fold metallo-hydrolase [Glutamicibacter sp.]|uniref:MBL fold metallo-hydrolase n=1 Tax=Glutamicibacter sp. TaxID=1931995 RepID=UPI003D6B96BB
MLGGLAAVGVLPLLGACAKPAASASLRSTAHTKVVLLGTTGGPAWSTGPAARQCIASALVVGDRYYLIDAGEGVGTSLMAAKLGNWQNRQPLSALHGIFVTHLHSDHIADLSNILSLGIYNGLARKKQPIPIWGPGNRGVLPSKTGSQVAPPRCCTG